MAWLTVMSWLPLGLMLCNWEWARWGRLTKLCVPGSLAHAEASRRRRFWRWWGFAYSPSWVPVGANALIGAATSGNELGMAFFGAILAVWPFFIRSEYRRLRQELEEDDDDWTKRAGRRLRKLGRSAARTVGSAVAGLAPGPSGAASGA